MPIGLLTLLGGWKNILIGGVVVVVGLVGWYYWNDYQDLQEDHKQLLKDYSIVTSINEENQREKELTIRQRKMDEAFATAQMKQRDKKEKKLYAQIAMLKSIQRPDADRFCPVHPAIERAVTWLRQAAGKDGGKNPARSTHSANELDAMLE